MATIIGTSGDDSIGGTSEDDLIQGLGGNDLLNGFEGANTLEGGTGDDTFMISGNSDTVVELSNEGHDTVELYGATYTLADNVEDLRIFTGSIVNASGNALDNAIYLDLGNSTELNQLYGMDGNDVIETVFAIHADGGAGDDVIYGDSAFHDSPELPFDELYGGTGDDLLVSLGGSDLMVGGEGADRFEIFVQDWNPYIADFEADVDRIGFAEDFGIYVNSTVTAENFHLGADATTADHRFLFDAPTGELFYDADGTGSDEKMRVAMVNVVNGSVDYTDFYAVQPEGMTRVEGTDGADTIATGGGRQEIDGKDGNDTLSSGDGNDQIFGGDGKDTINGGVGVDVLLGESGDDTIRGDKGEDYIYGGTGADHLYGEAGMDSLDGGAGADTLEGGTGNDYYYTDGNDKLVETANGGYDQVIASVDWTLAANYEELTLTGSANLKGTGTGGDDSVFGNDGDNLLRGLDGDDYLWGGSGDDTLIGGAGIDQMDGREGEDRLEGSGGGDFLFGGDDNDDLLGGAGNDLLDGESGGDTLKGGAGNDDLYSSGADTLTGGDGKDDFIFSAFGSGVSHVTDFKASSTDEVHIASDALAGLDELGVLDADLFHAGTAATTIDHRLIYDAAAGALYYDADGVGGAAQELILDIDVLTGTFNHNDIEIVA